MKIVCKLCYLDNNTINCDILCSKNENGKFNLKLEP
jgi:hypothetical protein